MDTPAPGAAGDLAFQRFMGALETHRCKVQPLATDTLLRAAVAECQVCRSGMGALAIGCGADGALVFRCERGCPTFDLLAALRLRVDDVLPPTAGDWRHAGEAAIDPNWDQALRRRLPVHLGGHEAPRAVRHNLRPDAWRDHLPNPEDYYRGRLEKVGRANGAGWAMARCPFHDDRQPSLTVNLVDGGWKCFTGCGEGGDVVSFHEQLTRLPFREAVRDLTGIDPVERQR